MVTPEMLLWLAGKVDVPACSYAPHLDSAQFGRLVVWMLEHGYSISPLLTAHISIAWKGPGRRLISCRSAHDSTPDSIRAAAVVAIAKALGWEDGK